jgi:hypothetical protein
VKNLITVGKDPTHGKIKDVCQVFIKAPEVGLRSHSVPVMITRPLRTQRSVITTLTLFFLHILIDRSINR